MSMKKFTTLALASLVVTSAFAQRPNAPKVVANHSQMTQREMSTKSDLLMYDLDNSVVRNSAAAEHYGVAANGKVAAVSPVALGSASNAFTILRTEQNQVYADPALDLVMFIHRNDANIYGGSSGNLRYDISIDGGATFTNDIGPLNPTLSKPARYPNITGYNVSGGTNPLDAMAVYAAPSLGSTWDGHVVGAGQVSQSAYAGTENYLFSGQRTLLPGGLAESTPGVFWTVDADYDGAASPGPLYTYKGTYNTGTQDVDWVRQDTINPPHFTGFDGTATFIGPNIAFSPDGQTGWIGWLGDLNGGVDTTLSPVFMKSTDGGATWGAPVEYNLNTEAWVADTLQTLWVDSSGSPASTGRATAAFDFDLTVDMNGNPHMFFVVGSGTSTANPDPGYSIFSGLAKFAADVTTPDGGATWEMKYISPVLAFRTPDFGSSTTVNMDNYPQISRSASGDFIFYSWADSDTAEFTGNANGIGFGESANLAPNLRIAGMNVSTGEQSYPQLVSDGDLIWEGRILYPTMAPITIGDGSGCWNLPIAIAEMPGGDPLQATYFHYFGNDAVVCSNTMCLPQSMNFAWDAFAFAGATPPCAVGVENSNMSNDIVLGNAFPNPTAAQAVITFELPAVNTITLDLVNVYGQQVAVIANGEFAAGAHKVTVNTDELASGVYFYNLRTNDQVLSKKLVVAK